MRLALALASLLPLLAGCGALPAIGGVAAGGGAGLATGNPAVGYIVGISTRAGLDYVQLYFDRSRHHGEQDQIAQAAGNAPLGEARFWEIRHTIPFGDHRGTLTVLRDIPNALAPCREVLFAVEDGGYFTTPVCRERSGWQWAAAEPSVHRWGFLQ